MASSSSHAYFRGCGGISRNPFPSAAENNSADKTWCKTCRLWPALIREAETTEASPKLATLRINKNVTNSPFLTGRSIYAGGAGGGGALNLDDMLSDLTSNPIADLAPGTGGSGPSSSSSTVPKRKRGLVTPQSARSRRSSGGGSTASRGSIGGSARRPPVPSAWTVRDYEDDAGASADGDYGDDNVGGVEHFDGEDDGGDAGDADGDAAMQDARAAGAAAAAAVVESGDASSAAAGGAEKVAAAAAVSPEAPEGEPAAAAAAAAKPRSRFARLKESNDIAVTAAAEEALRPKKPEIAEKDPAAVAGKGGEGKVAAGGVGSSYMPSLEFQGPQYSLSEAPSTSAGSVPSASSWLQKVHMMHGCGKSLFCIGENRVSVVGCALTSSASLR